MKKIEVIVKPEKVRAVLVALKEVGTGGVTVVPVKGQGKISRPQIRAARGALLFTAEYNMMNSVYTIVDDSMVDRIMSAIKNALTEGGRGNGKVFVFPVDEVMDLENGRRSSNLV